MSNHLAVQAELPLPPSSFRPFMTLQERIELLKVGQTSGIILNIPENPSGKFTQSKVDEVEFLGHAELEIQLGSTFDKAARTFAVFQSVKPRYEELPLSFSRAAHHAQTTPDFMSEPVKGLTRADYQENITTILGRLKEGQLSKGLLPALPFISAPLGQEFDERKPFRSMHVMPIGPSSRLG